MKGALVTLSVLIALSVALAGCGAESAPVIDTPAPEAPSCQGPVKSPLPPPKPRTVESIADWGNRTTVALEHANARLAACAALKDK
jgi:hypothetical protein